MERVKVSNKDYGKMGVNRIDFAKNKEFDNHELISYFFDRETGLRGFIAIHNTNLGPAAGATRYWKHSPEEALKDALRLSRAMTYKCALAKVPYGGGKSVIIADSKKAKTNELLKRYASKINLLKGSFYTGEDVGMNNKDVKFMAGYTPFVIGKSKKSDRPAYWTAVGVVSAIEKGLNVIFGSAAIKNRTIAIKGLGKVGGELCRLLYSKGANIIAADIDPKAVLKIKRKCPGVKIVSSSQIHRQKVDVYAPCALGSEFNKITIEQLRCQMICGGANNQLASFEDGEEIYKKDILYLPDYVVNSGGLINVVAELNRGGYNRRWVEEKVKGIGRTIQEIINLSKKNKQPANLVADNLARKIFEKR